MQKLLRYTLITVLCCMLYACGGNNATDNTSSEDVGNVKDTSHDHDHDHGDHVHDAPHGGKLVELGDHAGNIEFVLDVQDKSNILEASRPTYWGDLGGRMPPQELS